MQAPETQPCPTCGRPVAVGRRCLFCQKLGDLKPAPQAEAPPPAPVPVMRVAPLDDRPPVLRIPLWAAGLGLVAIVAALAWLFRVTTYDGEELCVVNTSEHADLSVHVDGKRRAEHLPRMLTEDATKAVVFTLDPGKHHVEARDPAGAVVEEVDVEVVKFSHGYLFAPGRRKDACFGVLWTEYGEGDGGPPEVMVPLSGSGHFWKMSDLVYYWFRPNPVTATAGKKETRATRRAVRLIRCTEGG
jgi:hypothetical protein